ncbi:hypothetical protein P168DRAFT_292221 [Aspergillus campestris IBT 28561]|uniref:Zn(2)-C6 fungal-type domain-containing protein n=1 Tax=Aspergillus campestris (strain IBT 28561) TaxID=1392248 RepID=A0A2I1CWW4_ASPC2|nr:uncharacterized protein P168DRAFT_292221 [Aspergillus campestris IBT 28561]PKY02116.1 hypothetical protein P168DRAFT_292221 [Aspergillus campestris IBT 28561]
MRRVKKSRNGCARCKSKRVKCGEEKPQCGRCTRLGVRCPGYVQSLRWVTKYPESVPDILDQDVTTRKDGVQFEPSFPSPSDQPVAPRSTSAAPTPFVNPLTQTLAGDGDFNVPSTQVFPGSRDSRSNETAALCDSLWSLQESDTLPELADLCPASPVASTGRASQRGSSIFELGSPIPSESNVEFLSMAAPSLQDESRHYPGFSPSNIVRKYPPSSPRPPPLRDFTSIPQPLNNPSWTLIEYYFKEVAALFSTYDSQMNPFRTTVSRLWGSSLAMCKTMQSMAAATLVNDFPHFGPLGRQMRNEAVDVITKEPSLDDKSLLALLMLGQTASWHDSTDLGISFFNLLRDHLDSKPSVTRDPGRSNNHQFFEEALVYWEMLLSFVADDATVRSGPSTAGTGESLVLQRVPHPWTGIARDTQSTMQEVGRLVRRERKRIRARRFTSHGEVTQARRALEKARELEERLLGFAHPAEAEIVSPGDDETPVWHLLTMAEVYRCTGLMQLYRAFPDLLQRRLPRSPPSSSSVPFPDPFLSVDVDTDPATAWFCDPSHLPTPEGTNPANPPPTDEPPPDASYHDTWLTEFALTTLSRLKTIPLESRTRCLQPFLLVAASSELRLPRSDDPSVDAPHGCDEHGPSISSHAIEVSRTRRFVLGRLTSFLHVLPPKPIQVCLQLVEEVWRRMDAGEVEAYWMDVMIEKGWETTMG